MSSLSHSASAVEKRTNARYWIVVMLFIVTSFNYGDRATLSIAGSEMAKDIGLDAVGMGYVFSAFSWAYVIGQIPGGCCLTVLGSKTCLFLVNTNLVWIYSVAGFCRYLQWFRHHHCALYPPLPGRPCRITFLPGE